MKTITTLSILSLIFSTACTARLGFSVDSKETATVSKPQTLTNTPSLPDQKMIESLMLSYLKLAGVEGSATSDGDTLYLAVSDPMKAKLMVCTPEYHTALGGPIIHFGEVVDQMRRVGFTKIGISDNKDGPATTFSINGGC